MPSDRLRLFVAITLPPAARDRLAPALAAASAIAPGARVVPIENLHLTLHFLGATPREERDRLEAALARVAAGSGPFPITIGGADSFGPRARPRVLYAAVPEGAEAIASLAARVDEAIGAEPQARYTPHVTLARARGPRGDPDLARARAELAARSGPSFVVRSLALMKSEVSQRGSRYRILSEAQFPA